jgi:type I restriction enzyme S subunit
MSFPRYPAYKDSGVTWLGEVPSHWSLLKLKHIATFSGGGTPSRDNPDYWSGDIPWVSPKDMKTEQLTGAEESITATGLANSTASLVPPNRLLMVVRSGILKHTIPVAINQLQVTLNQDMKALDFADEGLTSSFFLRWVQGLNDLLLLEWAKQGATVESIEHEYLANTVVPLPTASERATITSFLDREAAKIDSLVAEQEQLITVLKEKRQAVISHAVTKGLDPSVPMKDSGVEWLGEVPAHWKVMPIRLAARLESGHTPSRSRPDWWLDCTVPWFSLADVWQIREAGRDVVYETKEMVSELGLANSSARLLPKGTVMLSRTASVGFAAIMGVDMATTQDFANWVCGQSLLPEFLLDTFKAMKPEFNRMMMGSTHNTIYMPDIQAFRFALPSMNEQAQIVAYVRDATAQSDELIAEAKAAVSLLKERRSALISAAVTGQIDVRGLAPAQEQAA